MNAESCQMNFKKSESLLGINDRFIQQPWSLQMGDTSRQKTQKCSKEERKMKSSHSEKYILENYQFC